MHKPDDDTLAQLRGRLHDLMLDFARVDADGLDALDRGSWAVAAQIEQLRRHPLVRMLDDEVLGAIAAGALDPNVEARYLAMCVREMSAETGRDGAAGIAVAVEEGRHCIARPPKAVPAGTANDGREAAIAPIARSRLGFTTLERRGRDLLDVRPCDVSDVRAALIEAYEEGRRAAPCAAGQAVSGR